MDFFPSQQRPEISFPDKIPLASLQSPPPSFPSSSFPSSSFPSSSFPSSSFPSSSFPSSSFPSSSLPPSPTPGSSCSSSITEDIFEISLLSLTFLNPLIELQYQKHLVETSLLHIRLGYSFFLFFLFSKTSLAAFALSRHLPIFHQRAELISRSPLSPHLSSLASEGGDPPLSPSSLPSPSPSLPLSSSELEPDEIQGLFFTLVLGTLMLLFGLFLSFKRSFFLRFHPHLNLITFLVVGLISISLSNIFALTTSSSSADFLVITELYLLLFPFCFLLKLGFPRVVIGSWTIVTLFFVLEEIARRRRIEGEGGEGEGDFGRGKILTLGGYLILGVVPLNFLAYQWDSMHRKIFQKDLLLSSKI